MFWWQNPEERTFEATSGITVAVIETGDSAYYRVAPQKDALQPGQIGSNLLRTEETRRIVHGDYRPPGGRPSDRR